MGKGWTTINGANGRLSGRMIALPIAKRVGRTRPLPGEGNGIFGRRHRLTGADRIPVPIEIRDEVRIWTEGCKRNDGRAFRTLMRFLGSARPGIVCHEIPNGRTTRNSHAEIPAQRDAACDRGTGDLPIPPNACMFSDRLEPTEEGNGSLPNVVCLRK